VLGASAQEPLGAPSTPPGFGAGADPVVAEQIAEARSRAEREAAQRRTPEAAAQRLASRDLFRGLGSHGALGLAQRLNPNALGAARTPLVLGPGERLTGFASDRVAELLGPEGQRRRIESLLPLAVRGVDGQLRAVDLSLTAAGAFWQPANPLVQSALPTRLDDGVRLGSGSDELRLTPTGAAGASAGVREGDAVFYSGLAADTDFWVRPVEAGVRTFHSLRSPASPEEFDLRVSLPPGARLQAGEPGGPAARVLQGERVLARISGASAWDAEGAPVPVSIDAVGDVVRLRVPHRDKDVAYPITVDPVMDAYFWDGNQRADLGAWRFLNASGGKLAEYFGGAYLGTGIYIRNFFVGDFADRESGWWYYQASAGWRIYGAGWGELKNDTYDTRSCVNAGITTVNSSPWEDDPYAVCSRVVTHQWFAQCLGDMLGEWDWYLTNCVGTTGGGSLRNIQWFGTFANGAGHRNLFDFMTFLGNAFVRMEEGPEAPWVTEDRDPNPEEFIPDETGTEDGASTASVGRRYRVNVKEFPGWPEPRTIATVRHARDGYVIGNAREGWHIHATARSPATGASVKWRYGYLWGPTRINGGYRACGWMVATALREPAGSVDVPCSTDSAVQIPPSSFMRMANCSPSENIPGRKASCVAGSFVQATCSRFGLYLNARPWLAEPFLDPSPHRVIDTATDGPWVRWRYITRNNQFVMVKDAGRSPGDRLRNNNGYGSWLFMSRSCLPSDAVLEQIATNNKHVLYRP